MRPIEWSAELEERILEGLSDGLTLRQLCADETLPSRTTVYRWLGNSPEFRDQYARACEVRADSWADELLAIADETAFDTIETDAGGFKANTEWIARSRLRVDARKWLMARAAPRKYGDKVENVHTSPDGGPVSIEVRFVAPEPVAEDDE